MKTTFTPLLIALFIATPAMAEKPSWAGQGKPTAEKKDAFKSAAMDKKAEMEDAEGDAKEQMKQAKESKEEKSKKDYEEKREEAKEKMEKAKKSKEGKEHDHDDDDHEDKIKDKGETKLKGLEKQKAMKSEQLQNELGKGSEQGQAAREENSKKWWKLW